MKDEILICDCSSAEHQMVLRFDDDKDLGRMVFVEIHLVNKRWYERLWMGIKYIFGYKCCYGNFEEMILSPKHARQIYNLYRFLNKPNLKASETMREKDEIDQAFTDMMLKGKQNDTFNKSEPLEPIFKEDDIITDGKTSLIIWDVDKKNQEYQVHEINDGTTWYLPFSSQTTWKIDE